MFQKGDRVICIDARNVEHLTRNKEYVVVETERNWIQIKDDSGNTNWYFRIRFQRSEAIHENPNGDC